LPSLFEKESWQNIKPDDGDSPGTKNKKGGKSTRGHKSVMEPGSPNLHLESIQNSK